MGRFLSCFVFVLTLTPAAFSAAKTDLLRFSVSSTWTMPYGQIQNGVLVDGILLDVINAISKEMNLKPQIIVLPRNRTELAARNREYDIRCHLSKKWVPNPERFIWSEPLFKFSTIIIGNLQSLPIKSVSDLNGKTVGMVLGYTYPDLNEAIVQGKILRDDAENQTTIYQKLSVGHYPYAVTDNLSFEYHLKTPGQQSKLAKWKFEISSDESRCAILKNSRMDSLRISKAIQRLNEKGTFTKILERYR